VELPVGSERVQSLHGRRVQVGSDAFVGYQYSLPFMGGTFEKPKAGIATDLKALERLVDARTVFVSHSPALGLGETRIGSHSLGGFLKRQAVLAHIHGHSHAGFGRHGVHFNVASGGLERAMILDLATMKHETVTTNARPEA
jgi:Icc-related predicted phosphoesterase